MSASLVYEIKDHKDTHKFTTDHWAGAAIMDVVMWLNGRSRANEWRSGKDTRQRQDGTCTPVIYRRDSA